MWKLSWLAIASFAIATVSQGAAAVEIFYQQGFSANIYKYDTATSSETLLGVTGGPSDSFGMAFGPTGTLYAHDRGTQSLYTINTTTGAATLIGLSGIDAEDFTVNLAGTTGYATANSNLYSINLATGAATSLGSIGSVLDGLTTAPIAVVVNGTNYAAGTIFGVDSGSFYVVDVVGVSKTFLGGISSDETLDFGPDGTLYGHTGGQLFTIALNPLGSTALASTTPANVFGMAVRGAGATVPEPGSLALLALGLAGLGLMRRRRT